MSKSDQPAGVAADQVVRPPRQYSREEVISALRMVGDSMGGACAQAADMLEATPAMLLPGDHFTHDRTGAQFVCRAVTRHDYGGVQSVVRAEVESAA